MNICVSRYTKEPIKTAKKHLSSHIYEITIIKLTVKNTQIDCSFINTVDRGF